jgi:hypothetical protein
MIEINDTWAGSAEEIEIYGPGITVSCMVVAAVVRYAVRLQNVASPDCDADGLHFQLVSSQAVELKTMYESKPWQKVANPSSLNDS